MKTALLVILLSMSGISFAGPDEYSRELTKAKADRDYAVKQCKGEAKCLKEVSSTYQAAVKGLQDWHLKGAQKTFEAAAKAK